MGGKVSTILKEKRKELGLSVKTVLDELRTHGVEISDKTLYGWESGHRQPDADTFLSLCQIYGIDTLKGIKKAPLYSSEAMKLAKDYDDLDSYGQRVVRLVAEEEKARCAGQAKEKTMEDTSSGTTGTIIDLDKIIPFRRSLQPASAGIGFFLGPDDFETIYIHNNDLTRRASFGVPVSGDSMEPVYHNGDVLLLERAVDIRIGEVGVFTISGEGYVKERGDGVLISLNPAYSPIPMSESIRCNGRVIGILDPDWIVEK